MSCSARAAITREPQSVSPICREVLRSRSTPSSRSPDDVRPARDIVGDSETIRHRDRQRRCQHRDRPPAEVLALLGEKRCGQEYADENPLRVFTSRMAGTIQIEGSPVALTSPRDAMAHGIGMVVPAIFAACRRCRCLENPAGRPATMRPWLQWRGSPQVAMALRWLDQLRRTSIRSGRVRSLSVGERQLVELAKVPQSQCPCGHSRRADIGAHAPTRLNVCTVSSGRLPPEGKAVVLITHKLADYRGLCRSHRGDARRQGGRSGRSIRAHARKPLVERDGRTRFDGNADQPKPPSKRRPGARGSGPHRRGAGPVHSQHFSSNWPPAKSLASPCVRQRPVRPGGALAGLVPVSGGDVVLDGVSIASRREDGGIDSNVRLYSGTPGRQCRRRRPRSVAQSRALRHARKLALFPSRREIEARAGQLIADYDVRPTAAQAGGRSSLRRQSAKARHRPRIVRIARGW